MSNHADILKAAQTERDRLTMVLDEVYEQRDHYRRSLNLIHEAFPDNVELREMIARALGHTFPIQMRNM